MNMAGIEYSFVMYLAEDYIHLIGAIKLTLR